MTIASALNDLNTDIQNARTAITNKGGTITSDGGSSQLATDIGTITELKGETKTINPSTTTQTITPSEGKNGITSATVNPVTYSIDANIQAGNIKKDVEILGVTGTFEGGITPSGTISITANATYDVANYANAQVNVPNGNTAIWGATIEDIFPNTNYTNTQPTNHEIIMNVTSSAMTNNGGAYRYCSLFKNSGIRKFTCNTTNVNYNYWMFEICRDAKYLEEFNFPNITQASGQYAFESAARSVTNGAYYGKLKKVYFPNLTSAGGYTFRYAFIGSLVDNATINFNKLQSVGTYCFYQGFASEAGVFEEASFPALTGTSNSCFYQAFMGTYTMTGGPKNIKFDALTSCGTTYTFYHLCYMNQTVEYVSFDKLQTITGPNSFSNVFVNAPNLKKVNFRSLVTVSATNGMAGLFTSCPSFPITYCFESLQTIGNSINAAMKNSFCGTTPTENVFFPSLTTIGCNNTTATNAMFNSCTFKRLYLPKWVTSSGTGAANLFTSCDNLIEFHFGKANQSTIEAMSGYATLWGRGAGNATVYFDLINTITVGGVDYTRDGPDYQIDYDGGTSYYSWKNGSDIIYTTEPYTPAVNDNVYTKSGDTYSVSGTISATA